MTDMIQKSGAAPKRQRRMAREMTTGTTHNAASVPVSPQAPTKASQVKVLLQDQKGATLDEVCQATGWLPHTCRAFLTGLRKNGHQVTKEKRADGATVYRIAETEATT